jgi:hypothetical protein
MRLTNDAYPLDKLLGHHRIHRYTRDETEPKLVLSGSPPGAKCGYQPPFSPPLFFSPTDHAGRYSKRTILVNHLNTPISACSSETVSDGTRLAYSIVGGDFAMDAFQSICLRWGVGGSDKEERKERGQRKPNGKAGSASILLLPSHRPNGKETNDPHSTRSSTTSPSALFPNGGSYEALLSTSHGKIET